MISHTWVPVLGIGWAVVDKITSSSHRFIFGQFDARVEPVTGWSLAVSFGLANPGKLWRCFATAVLSNVPSGECNRESSSIDEKETIGHKFDQSTDVKWCLYWEWVCKSLFCRVQQRVQGYSHSCENQLHICISIWSGWGAIFFNRCIMNSLLATRRSIIPVCLSTLDWRCNLWPNRSLGSPVDGMWCG